MPTHCRSRNLKPQAGSVTPPTESRGHAGHHFRFPQRDRDQAAVTVSESLIVPGLAPGPFRVKFQVCSSAAAIHSRPQLESLPVNGAWPVRATASAGRAPCLRLSLRR